MIKNTIYNLLSKYYKNKYGPLAEICSVCFEGDKIKYQFMQILDVVDSVDNVRPNCGQYILTRYGLNLIQSNAIIILLPHWSLIKKLGFLDYLKFINSWEGNSKVGENVVVQYKVIGD